MRLTPEKRRVMELVKRELEKVKKFAKPDLIFPKWEELKKAIELVPDKHLALIREFVIEVKPLCRIPGECEIGWSGKEGITLYPLPKEVYETYVVEVPERPGWDREIWKCAFLHELGHIVYDNLPEDKKEEFSDIYAEESIWGPPIWELEDEFFSDCYLGFLTGDTRVPTLAYNFMEELIGKGRLIRSYSVLSLLLLLFIVPYFIPFMKKGFKF